MDVIKFSHNEYYFVSLKSCCDRASEYFSDVSSSTLFQKAGLELKCTVVCNSCIVKAPEYARTSRMI